MASKHQDVILWTCLGVFGFYIARAVHMQLRAVRAASQITLDNRPQDSVNLSVENALKVETLWHLTQSPNPDIRAASIRIITNRALQGATYNLILEDIVGHDQERRDKALTCLNFLSKNPQKFPTPLYDTYKAIFTCLCNLHTEMLAFEIFFRDTDESTRLNTNRMKGNREPASRDALSILALLLQYDSRDAVRAGLVVSWLVKYPFGGHTSTERKKKIIADIVAWFYEDPPMHTIVTFAIANDEARQQLVQHGLVDKAKDTFQDIESDPDFMWYVGPEGVVESTFTPFLRRNRRIREESVEEQALRRRRRHAMVLGEVGRPIQRSDIIERQNTQDEREVEQELQGLVAESQEAEHPNGRSWWNWRPWSLPV